MFLSCFEPCIISFNNTQTNLWVQLYPRMKTFLLVDRLSNRLKTCPTSYKITPLCIMLLTCCIGIASALA